jgi:hypothetical protein
MTSHVNSTLSNSLSPNKTYKPKSKGKNSSLIPSEMPSEMPKKSEILKWPVSAKKVYKKIKKNSASSLPALKASKVSRNHTAQNAAIKKSLNSSHKFKL